MPEWKSFTFGEDGEATLAPEQSAPEAAASTKSAMEPDEYAAKWGTEVSELTIERIVTVLEGDGLECESDEFIVATWLNDVPLQIHREPADAPWAQVETRIVPPGEGHTEISLQELANRWNVGHLQPTVFPIENGDNWILVAASRFFVGEGLSDRQIHAMARRGLIIGLQAAEELPTLFDESEDSEQ